MNLLGRATFGTVCALALVAAIAAAPAGAANSKAPVAGKSIIAGSNADFAQWPYVAAVYRKGRLHCGGSVIAPTKILTAAHCVEGFNPTKLTVVTGRPNLKDTSVGQEIGVASAVPHPDYRVNQVHDTGIITLVSPTAAPPVLLPTPEEGPLLGQPGQTLRVAGWGARNPFGFRLANVLKTTTEVIRAPRRCRRVYRRLFKPVAMICSLGAKLKRFGRPAIHTTACTGDSGGPLVADTTLGPKVVGTVSFGGAFCGLAASPTVYSRVTDSLPFIAQYG